MSETSKKSDGQVAQATQQGVDEIEVHPPQQQNTPVIGYKRRRTKEIIYHGKRPSDIVSNASAPDDDLEGKDIMQEEESKPKWRKTGENEVNMRALSSFHLPFFC